MAAIAKVRLKPASGDQRNAASVSLKDQTLDAALTSVAYVEWR